MVIIEAVGNRCIEVLSIYEQMVVRSLLVTLNKVTMNTCGRCLTDETVACMAFSVIIVLVKDWFYEVTIQYAKSLRIHICSRRINHEVLCLVAVLDAQQTVVVKQRSVELPSLSVQAQPIRLMGLIGLINIIMSLEVDSCHARISLTRRGMSLYLCCGQFLLLCQICMWVEVCHTHVLRTVVCRSTVDAVGISAC